MGEKGDIFLPESYPIMVRLQQEHPKSNVLIAAAMHLKDEKEIADFGREYVNYLEENDVIKGEREQESPQERAAVNIGFMLGHCDAEVQDRWGRALPQMRARIGMPPGPIAVNQQGLVEAVKKVKEGLGK